MKSKILQMMLVLSNIEITMNWYAYVTDDEREKCEKGKRN